MWNRIIDPFFYLHSHEFVVSTSFGMRIAGDTRDIIQGFIYFFGMWEPSLTRWIQERLAPGDIFIDVGANIGYYSLLASKLVGHSGSVVAIEPSPKIFSALQHNLALNHIENVRVVNMAVSDRREALRLFRGA
jgi:tRNA/tmRNA/rRNA uracil-C5-methylase (TrmA/RlmC/RlmD family)